MGLFPIVVGQRLLMVGERTATQLTQRTGLDASNKLRAYAEHDSNLIETMVAFVGNDERAVAGGFQLMLAVPAMFKMVAAPGVAAWSLAPDVRAFVD